MFPGWNSDTYQLCGLRESLPPLSLFPLLFDGESETCFVIRSINCIKCLHSAQHMKSI